MHGPSPQLFRRRRPRSAGVLALLALVLVVVPAVLAAGPAVSGGADGSPTDSSAGDATATGGPALTGSAAEGGPAVTSALADSDPEQRVRRAEPGEQDVVPFVAEVDGLSLRLPAADVEVVGFHEASTAVAVGLEPVGRLRSNANTTRFSPPPSDPAGSDYLVLSSRGRPQAPTSAIDVVLRDDVDVLAPVTGTVTDVRTYWLYGEHRDHRVEIVPDAAPELRVVLVHVDGVRVAAGDRVEAATTVLATTANRFPFSSQIDRETEPDRWPHVHLEVQPADAPRPGDDAG